jgi:signal transduction histidine kinase
MSGMKKAKPSITWGPWKTSPNGSNLESQLLHSQKMEAIGTLAGGIAHDFNNILTAIVGYGNLLQLRMEKGDPSRRYVDRILSSSQKAINLTGSLLAFSRKQPVELRPHRVGSLIEQTESS